MGELTKIEWTDHTWNPWTGCAKVSAGCANCYMFTTQARFGRDPHKVTRTSPATFNAPLKWKEPARVFTCSWSDFFLPEADAWRAEAWEIIRRTPHLTYQVLTKRPENIPGRLPEGWGDGWENVWLGVTVENAQALRRAELLAGIAAKVRFISYEPALGPVDFSPVLASFGWLISGGESGHHARPADPAWFRSVREQCRAHGVPYFHKQNGGRTKEKGEPAGGRLLDGVLYHESPDVSLVIL